MLKYAFILINSLSLFLFGLFSGDGGVVITGNIPTIIKIGDEIPVEIILFKENIFGFAKYQLNLPEGFTVKPENNAGAEFSNEDGTAKWTWEELPESEEISIKFTLSASDIALGTKTISSSFQYIEYNEKKSADDPGVQVTVIKAEAPAPIASTETLAPTTPSLESHAEPDGTIEVIRTISKQMANGEYQISLNIKKGITKGFARYSDDLQDGVIAKSIKTDGSSFSVSDGKLKFVWVNVPEKTDLEISYTVNFPSLPYLALGGEYSYLENNQSKKVKLESDSLKNASTVIAKNEAPINLNTSGSKKDATKKEPNSNKTTPDGTLIKQDGRANYHIQIGAFTNKEVTSNTLKNKFNIEETVNSEMHEGFSKFMIGNYIDYKKARDKRESVKNGNGVKSAFVVAYNDGKRITVQEALMISNQKWYK